MGKRGTGSQIRIRNTGKKYRTDRIFLLQNVPTRPNI